MKAGPADLEEKLGKLVERERALEKELADTKRKAMLGGGTSATTGGGNLVDDLCGQARDLPNHAGAKILSTKVEVADVGMLRELAEKVRDKLGEAIVLLGAKNADKAQLVLCVSKGLMGTHKAGDLIRPIAQELGGSGGGRPDMAQAGGTHVEKLEEALSTLYARLA